MWLLFVLCVWCVLGLIGDGFWWLVVGGGCGGLMRS